MSEKIVRVGLIGAGTMAEYHLKGFRAAGAEIVGIVDQNSEKGGAFARKWGVPGGTFPSLDALYLSADSGKPVRINDDGGEVL